MRNHKLAESRVCIELVAKLGVNWPIEITPQQFKARLVKEYHDLGIPQQEFSGEARKWMARATDCANNGMLLPKFPDEDELLYVDYKEGTKNRSHNRKKRRKSGGTRAKEIMLEKGVNMRPTTLLQMLHDEGYQYSMPTLKIVQSEFKQTMKLLRDRKLLVAPTKEEE